MKQGHDLECDKQDKKSKKKIIRKHEIRHSHDQVDAGSSRRSRCYYRVLKAVGSGRWAVGSQSVSQWGKTSTFKLKKRREGRS